MSSENLHAPRERLTKRTLLLHDAVVSLMEELDAIDWYRQRSDDTEDDGLRAILLHNMREEMEHASMLLEWIRRNDGDFARHLKTYLFTEAPILETEIAAEHSGGAGATEASGAQETRGFTIGPLQGR